jgi:DNA replication protein DnaC
MRDVITPEESRLLLDLIDDRYQSKSMMFISQFAVKDWHDRFEDPTIG